MGPGPRRLDAVHSYDLTLASSILLSSRTVRQGVRTWWVPHDLIISWALVLPSPGPGLLARSRVTHKTFACSRRCPGSAALGGTGAGLWVRPACAASAVLLAPGVWLQRLRGGKRNHQKRRTGRVWRDSRCPGVWGAGGGEWNGLRPPGTRCCLAAPLALCREQHLPGIRKLRNWTGGA